VPDARFFYTTVLQPLLPRKNHFMASFMRATNSAFIHSFAVGPENNAA
jgi:hypothetical protein